MLRDRTTRNVQHVIFREFFLPYLNFQTFSTLLYDLKPSSFKYDTYTPVGMISRDCMRGTNHLRTTESEWAVFHSVLRPEQKYWQFKI